MKLSNEVKFCKIKNKTYIGWNRFYPRLLKFSEGAVFFLENLEKIEDVETAFVKFPGLKDELLKNKFIYNGEVDNSKNDFFELVDNEHMRINQSLDDFYNNTLDYAQLYIYNDRCNLSCSYCAKNYKNPRPLRKFTQTEKIRTMNLVVDQYIERKVKNNAAAIPISFNGGEILLEWNFIKALVLRNQNKYPDLKFKYFLNSNVTLFNEEIAEFLNKYDFDIVISIDGYREAHELTRIYKNGKGSFNDVIKGLEIYHKYNKEKPITDFQGTIENPDSFQPHKIFEMKQYGFKSARLSPNLLNVTVEDAKKKTKLMDEILKLNLERDFQVGDINFENIRDLIRSKEYRFYLNCMGLSCRPRPGLFVSISKLCISQLCSFLSKPVASIGELNYNIYNPALREVTQRFIKQRLDILKRNCIECELVGICKGSCVLSGIDCENRINEAACLYQKEVWKLLLAHLYVYEMEVEAID